MIEELTTMEAIYHGWQNYQGLLIAAIIPLNTEELCLRSAPHMRSIEEIATHMIGARGRWFSAFGNGDNQLAALSHWDRHGGPERTAAEITEGLQFTMDYIIKRINSWSQAEWKTTMPGERLHEPHIERNAPPVPGSQDMSDPPEIRRPWIIWHLIEHDLHHGGEISLTMGIHHLKAPEI